MVFKVFHECFMEVLRVFKEILRVFQWSGMWVSRVFKRSSKGVQSVS